MEEMAAEIISESAGKAGKSESDTKKVNSEEVKKASAEFSGAMQKLIEAGQLGATQRVASVLNKLVDLTSASITWQNFNSVLDLFIKLGTAEISAETVDSYTRMIDATLEFAESKGVQQNLDRVIAQVNIIQNALATVIEAMTIISDGMADYWNQVKKNFELTFSAEFYKEQWENMFQSFKLNFNDLIKIEKVNMNIKDFVNIQKINMNLSDWKL